jgi:hypothetical protein
VPPFAFLAHRSLLDQHTALGEVHTWLHNRGGISDVRYVPSSIRRREVRARVEPTMSLGETVPTDAIDLRVAFEFPEHADLDYYEIQWIDGDRDSSFGWHQDETHSDLGECHFQLDYRDETISRRSAVFHDSHPLGVLETRLSQVPAIRQLIQWEDDRPSLARWPPKDI